MNVFLVEGIMLIVTIVIGLVVAYLVYLSNSKSKVNRIFLLMTLFSLAWISFSFFGSVIKIDSLALIMKRLNYAFLPPFFVTAYLFSVYFPNEFSRKKIVEIIMELIGIISFVIAIATPLVVDSVKIEESSNVIVGGKMYDLLNIVLSIITVIIISNLVRKYFTVDRKSKKQVIFVIVGAVLYALFNVIFNVVLPSINAAYYKYDSFGDFSFILFLLLTSYAIIRHHLFDVKLAIVRSVTYVFVLVSLACLYLDIVFIISGIFDRELASPGQIATGVVTSLILAFVFQPLKRFFDKVTNKIFYKDNYNTDDFFTRVNESLTSTTDLRNLLEQIAHEIGNTLKSEQTFFYINTDNDHYVSAGTQHHRQLPKADAEKLGELCGKSGDIVIASMLEPEDEVRRLLLSHRIELILPLVESNKIIGYLCLGDHRSNSGYTNRDVKALNAVSDEIAIAIQNALAVQEIREFNSTLQQRIENATKELRSSNSALRHLDKTKDEFVGMASHQLRTPLTSVKGYISMVLEGDAGKVSDMQRKFLEEAFMSSERMVRLIDDFLNVSRIQNGKFIIDKHEVDLSKVVEQEIDSLTPSAKMRNMKFVYDTPTDIPAVSVDEGKLRQVIMNFADNALYYSHDNTKIVINLSVQDKDIVFTVKDTGIGIPLSEQGQLFTKFYRASNARKQRPDGTGVGLYLAKKIIDAHGGKVIFLSIEGKGSMFGFRIPIDQSVESTTAS
ncbi:MAG: ATP-binding protein [Candidatus Saccharibacteria bacterium]